MVQVNQITYNGLQQVVTPVTVESFDAILSQMEARFNTDNSVAMIEHRIFENGIQSIQLKDARFTVIESYKTI